MSLAACAPGASTPDCPTTPSGSVSDSIEVSGDFGAAPEVTIPSPVSAEETQRTVAIQGDGETVVEGDTVLVEYKVFNGESGEELDSTEYGETPVAEFTLDEAALLPGIVKTLECSTVGSRVVGVVPAIDAFGDAGQETLGVAADESLVFVVDIIEVAEAPEPALPRANGEDQEPTPGLPTVELDADGRPTITLPDSAPPTDLQIAVLKKGDGPEVTDGADVVVHYEGLNWNTGVTFDSSWERGEPATFNVNGVIPGFTQALVGQTVGSQVLAVIPPEFGYGEAGAGEDIGGTDTLVFVVDILGLG